MAQSTQTMKPHDIDLTRVHLVGIGGAGMSGVARILLDRGSVVSGSDVKDSRPVRALRTMGATVAVGHDAHNLELTGQLPTVVVTSFKAIPEDNPELQAARENNIPVVKRSDVLAALMLGKKQILIAGTHGKTSTTSMAVVALQACGLDPSFAIGGQLNRAGTNAHSGTGEAFVAEADESDASLLTYRPDIAVITNIEPDHLDFYGSEEAYVSVFDDFADRLRDTEGTLIVCLNDAAACTCGLSAQERGITVLGYGTRDAVDAHSEITPGAVVESIDNSGVHTQAVIRVGDQRLTPTFRIPGVHMVLNGAAALLAGSLSGGELDKLVQGLSEFSGVRRRFEFHGRIEASQYEGVRVYDDYAHHPTEVSAVLTAAKEKVVSAGKGKVIVVFQPHLYSRTMNFAAEFAQALSLADAVIVLDIYGAREQPVEGVDSRIITSQVTAPVVRFEPNFMEVPEDVAQLAEPDDLVITMGAGSVTLLADQIVSRLNRDSMELVAE